MVRWLGFEPWKITYSSDNFQKLYDFAMELTKRGKAFVCHCDQETMAAAKGSGKGNPQPCPHRDRPVQENIREFQAMKDGKYPEKGACLRMKIDLSSGNPYMWDPVCYRVKDAPHHRTGTTWSRFVDTGSLVVTELLLQKFIPPTTLLILFATRSKTLREWAPSSFLLVY